MRRDYCGGCGLPESNIKTFLDLGSSPLANDTPKSVDVAEEYHALELGVCQKCWLVQLMDVVPDDVVFGGDYTFYSSTSPALTQYHKSYAAEIMQKSPPETLDFVVEIACNDGDLLQHLAGVSRAHLGIDPATGPAIKATERGLTVLNAPFSESLAHEIVSEHGHASLVLANHVTAHVTDLHDFLSGIRVLIGPAGKAVLEVQYLPDLILRNQIDHVYHEHRAFFSATSLVNATQRVGLRATNFKRVAQQGGSMQLTLVRDADRRRTPMSNVTSVLDREARFRDLNVYLGTQARADQLKHTLLTELYELRRAGKRVHGYGMPAKAVTLLNFCGIGPELVPYIVDTTPAKIGRFSPGTHIPIVSPGDVLDPDVYLLFVWNYLTSVLNREKQFTADGGKFLIPIPAPVMM